MSSKGDPIIIGIALAGAGALAFYWGLGQYHLKKTIEYTPTSKAVAVAPGIAEVSGVAREFEGKAVSPFGKKECVYYSTQLYKWSGSGKHRHRYFVEKWESKKPIYLEDETGRVMVQPTLKPKGSETAALVKTDEKASDVPDKRGFVGSLLNQKVKTDPNDPVYRFVSEFYPSLSTYSDKLDVEETFIADGDPIYVIGTAKIFDPNEETPRIIIWDDPARKIFCMADGSEKEALSEVSLHYKLGALGGPLLFYVGYFIIIARLNAVSSLSLFFGALISGGMYLWLAGVFLLAVYNGLITLKNSIDRAKANVDTLLEKRHTLIPQLVEVVKGYAAHERKLQAKIAELRSMVAPQAGKSLIALAEAYPQLRASENFTELQEQLAKVESEIAGSRNYYNDSVMLYNKQIASFPHLLVARALGLKEIEYYKWEE
jgi:LemA protein